MRDLFLVCDLQVRMHGQAEYPATDIFANRKIAALIAQTLEGGLEMKGRGIVNGRRNAGRLEGVQNLGAMPIIFGKY